MDTSSFNKLEEPVRAVPRLPAGSTLEIAPGVHVPHPEAEVNLPGAGDPRQGDDTKAVTERVTIVDGVQKVEAGPLSDDVKAKARTVDPSKRTLPETLPGVPVTTSVTPGEHLAEETAK